MTGDTPLSILVVDDDTDGADSLATLLQIYGYRVTVARTGAEALELAAADPPDVALLDVLMPGLDGWEVARWLREQSCGRRPLLVAVTGCGSDADRRRSAEAGMDLHLVKPVEPAVLAGVLEGFRRILTPPCVAADHAPPSGATDGDRRPRHPV